MKPIEKFKLSKYTRIVERSEDFAIYHSLYGGLCIIDKGIVDLLNLFKTSNCIDDIVKKSKFSHEYIKSLFNIFEPKKILIDSKFDEDLIMNQRINERENSLHTGQQIGVIQLIVTNLCNFRCEYCFTNLIYSSNERMVLQKDKNNKSMTTDLARTYIEEVISAIRNAGRNTLHIQFFGGEPLVNWKVVKYVLEKFNNGIDYNINITYSIVTNGSLITEEVAEYFKKYEVPVVVSFDSPKGDDRLMASGENSFDKIKKGLSLLKKHKNRIVFNSVFSKETFEYFDNELVDFAVKYEISEIGVLFDLDPLFYEIKTTDEIVDKLWSLYKYGKDKGVIVTGYWHMIFQQLLSVDSLYNRGFKTCSATGCQLSIEPTGDIFACKGSSGHFGKIKDIQEVFKSSKYTNYAMRAYRNPLNCRNCEIENFCSGFCLGPLEKKYNNIYIVEESTCNVYKELTRKLIADIDKNEIESYFTIEN